MKPKSIQNCPDGAVEQEWVGSTVQVSFLMEVVSEHVGPLQVVFLTRLSRYVNDKYEIHPLQLRG